MRQIACIAFLLLFFLPGTYSQDNKEFKKTFLDGEYFMMIEEYSEALHYFNELLKLDPQNANLHFLAGACYISLYGQKLKATPHLEEAVQSISTGYREGSYKERGAPREALFALARAYQINNDFDKAIKQYETYKNAMFKRHFADIEYVNHQIKSCELGKSMIRKPIEVQMLDVGGSINRFNSNYNPVFARNDSLVIYMTDKPLYRAIMESRRGTGGWSEPKDITSMLGSDGDCYPTCLSRDASELYIVKKDAFESNIYISRRVNGAWTVIEELNQNINTQYYESHASLSLDGRKLLFTSDRPGGQGAQDIWMSVRSSTGDWLPPVNMGPRINSHYNEETPFFTENQRKIYFSSQGHATMGGYDIFVSERLPDALWSFPENLGYPVSTADDDLFYVPRSNGWKGYLATSQDSLEGVLMIYALRFQPPEEMQIAARRQGEIIDMSVQSSGIKPTGTIPVKTDTGSVFTATGPEHPDTIAAMAQQDSTPVKRIIPGPVEADEYFVLNSLMFDFDSDQLNEVARAEADRVYEVMRKHPEIELELTGHTDAVGSDEYNLRLSNRRAESIANYLEEKGIERRRMKVAGLGESNPIARNVYEDGSDSPDGRSLNRHVSLKLRNLEDQNVEVAEIFVPDQLKPRSEKAYTVLLLQSESMLDTVPDEFLGESVALVITDESFLYTAGNFDRKPEAMRYLNEVIDLGYEDASMIEKSDLERLIAQMSSRKLTMEASYTIQIMALKNPVDISYFNPLEDVFMHKGIDGLHRYIQGDYKSIDRAMQELPRIRELGYDDAFIMSVLRYK